MIMVVNNHLREAIGRSRLTRVEIGAGIDPREVAITVVAAAEVAEAATQEAAAIDTEVAAMMLRKGAPTTISQGNSNRLRTSCAHSDLRISPMR